MVDRRQALKTVSVTAGLPLIDPIQRWLTPPRFSPQRRITALLAGIRATPLDPMRPALDLLEDLLAGIRGCWLLYQDYADDEAPFMDDEDFDDEADDEGGEADPSAFVELLRADAAAHAERLT